MQSQLDHPLNFWKARCFGCNLILYSQLKRMLDLSPSSCVRYDMTVALCQTPHFKFSRKSFHYHYLLQINHLPGKLLFVCEVITRREFKHIHTRTLHLNYISHTVKRLPGLYNIMFCNAGFVRGTPGEAGLYILPFVAALTVCIIIEITEWPCTDERWVKVSSPQKHQTDCKMFSKGCFASTWWPHRIWYVAV